MPFFIKNFFFLVLPFTICILFFNNKCVAKETFKIDSIVFRGNEKTRANILQRELDFVEGDSIPVGDLENRIEYNRRKLMNTNLFIWVHSDFHVLASGNIKITYEFLEQWYLIGYPFFQLADRNLNEWWTRGGDFGRANYGARFLHNNFMGRNEKIILKAETGFTQRIEFSYQNPYIDPKKTLGLTINIGYTTQKNIAYKTNMDTLTYFRSNEILMAKWLGGIQLRKRLRFYDFQTLDIKYTHSVIADTINSLNPNYFGQGKKEQNFTQIGYAFSYDLRDFINYPLRGKKIDFSFIKYGILPRDNVNFWEATASAALYVDLGTNFFFASQVKTKISKEIIIPYANIRGLGYENDLVRGYELNVIDGNGYFLWRNTAKYQLFSKTIYIPFIKFKQFNQIPIAIYPTAFVDLGYVYNPTQNGSKNTNQWLFGTGLGFDFVTYYNFVCRLGFPITNGGKSGMAVSIGREF